MQFRYPMTALFAAAAIVGLIALTFCSRSHAADELRVDVAIVFVADTSDSVSADERDLERRSHAEALKSQEVLDAIAHSANGAIAAAYIEFGETAWLRVGWTRIDGRASAESFGDHVGALGIGNAGGTGIGAGLNLANTMLAALPFPADRLVVDIMGDGRSNTGPSVDEARSRLLDLGVVINGMPMISAAADADIDGYYKLSVAGGPGHFTMPLTNLEEMPEALREKILLELY